MHPLFPPLTRRTFLRGTGAALASACLPAWADDAAPLITSFFVIGDTHYRADTAATDKLDAISATCTSGLVAVLNRLPGTAIPEAAGGGVVAPPIGVLHVGDLIDSGDKTDATHLAMQHTEWAAYLADFGLTGAEGRLKLPVMDIAGNHDCPHGTGYAAEQFVVRHRTRKGLTAISANGLHYSWDWAGAHFIALGLIVGNDPTVTRPRRYAAMESLAFLREDLAAHHTQDQPLIIMHHVDVARYTAEKEGTDYTKWEWDPADVHAFYRELKGRKCATFHGHTHKRDIQRWDGQSTKAATGLGVFNVDNSAHFGMESQAFFYVELRANGLLVREYASPDRWQTGAWTPQVWRNGW